MNATFSAVIVVRNEEALIQRCLESVAWCDERIVIDMDSSDRTRERAMPLATKIVEQEYQLRCFRRGAGLYPDRLHSRPEVAGRVLFLPLEEDAWILHERDGQTIGDLVRQWGEYADKEARTRLRDGAPPPGLLAMIWAAVSAFRFRFFVSRGYRDGVPGLVLSMLVAFHRFEVEAKGVGGRGVSPRRRPRRTSSALAAVADHGAGGSWVPPALVATGELLRSGR